MLIIYLTWKVDILAGSHSPSPRTECQDILDLRLQVFGWWFCIETVWQQSHSLWCKRFDLHQIFTKSSRFYQLKSFDDYSTCELKKKAWRVSGMWNRWTLHVTIVSHRVKLMPKDASGLKIAANVPRWAHPWWPWCPPLHCGLFADTVL